MIVLQKVYLKLRKVPFPEIVRNLEDGDAKFLGQQPVSVVRVLDFGDDQLTPEIALGVLAAVGARRRIPLLAAVRRQLVDGVVRFGKLAAGQHGREVVLGQPVGSNGVKQEALAPVVLQQIKSWSKQACVAGL